MRHLRHALLYLLAAAASRTAFAAFGGAGKGVFSQCLLTATLVFGVFGGLWICMGIFSVTLAVVRHPQRSRIKQAVLGALLGFLVWPLMSFSFCAVSFGSENIGEPLAPFSGLACGLAALAAAAFYARSAPAGGLHREPGGSTPPAE